MMMKLFLLFYLSFSLSIGGDVALPRYVIDLDQPPEERWKEIATEYSETMRNQTKYFSQSGPAGFYDMVTILGGDLESYLPDPYAGEIKGVANYAGITAGEILFLNIIYELTAFGQSDQTLLGCTSIVSKTSNGLILHGRNLDYHIGLLRQSAIIIDYQQSEVTLYTVTTFAGYVGALTGQKPNSFTISLDERDKGDWHNNVLEAQNLGTKGFVSFKVRDLLADPNADFDSVVDTISNTQFIAPFYAIVGGVSGNEGAVITHNRSNAIDVWRLDDTNGRWFILETNYDHWMPPPDRDNRRDPANYIMNTTGLADINNDTMYTVLSTPPVLNDRTIYTVIMSAADPDLYNGWIRFPEH